MNNKGPSKCFSSGSFSSVFKDKTITYDFSEVMLLASIPTLNIVRAPLFPFASG